MALTLAVYAPAAQSQTLTVDTFVLSGDTAPDGNGVFSGFDRLDLNSAGQILFKGDLTGTSGGTSDDEGLFRADGMTGLTQIAREGQSAPDGNGSISQLNRAISFNNAGQVAFHTFLTGNSGGNQRLFLADGVTGLTEIAREGQSAPDGNGSITLFSDVLLNDNGQVAFEGRTSATGSGSVSFGLFLADDVNGLTPIVSLSDSVPDGNGSFGSFNSVGFNNAGQISFTSRLSNTSGGTSDDRGVFLNDDVTGLMEIVREGQTAPNGNDSFGGDFPGIEIEGFNDAGQIALRSTLIDADGNNNFDRGIYLYDSVTGLTEIAQTRQSAPDGNGQLNLSGSVISLNDAGKWRSQAPSLTSVTAVAVASSLTMGPD